MPKGGTAKPSPICSCPTLAGTSVKEQVHTGREGSDNRGQRQVQGEVDHHSTSSSSSLEEAVVLRVC